LFAALPSFISNSILYFDIAPFGKEIHEDIVTLTVSDSAIQGGYVGSGNFSSDPGFVSQATGDLRLIAGSPCIDRGNIGSLPSDLLDMDADGDILELIPMDFARKPRRIDAPLSMDTGTGGAPLADLGAYERWEPAAFGLGSPGCQGVQVLASLGTPQVGGSTFQLTATACPPSSLGLLLAGTAPSLLGLDVFGIGVPTYVDLLLSTEVHVLDFPSDGSGFASIPIPIPPLSSLAFSNYYAQGLFLWTQCSLPPYQLSGTNGLQFVILP